MSCDKSNQPILVKQKQPTMQAQPEMTEEEIEFADIQFQLEHVS